MYVYRKYIIFQNTDAPVEVIESRPARIRCGGCRPVTDFKEVEDKLNNSLTKLASADGPNYKFVFHFGNIMYLHFILLFPTFLDLERFILLLNKLFPVLCIES